MTCPFSSFIPSHASSLPQCSKLSSRVLNTLSSFLSQGVCIYQNLWLECLIYSITTWLLLVQRLCLTSNITSLERPSLTTFPSLNHCTSYCTFIFLPKLISIWNDTPYASVCMFIVCEFSHTVNSVRAMILCHSSLYPQHLEQCLGI